MIDIIIPVYNTQIEDLQRCVNSIFYQDYEEWMITLVDDGSERDLATWIDRNYGQNPRIQIIHTENNGVSNARNKGISCSSGEYIVFCDADDTLISGFLEHAVSLMERYNLDMVIGGCKEIGNGMARDRCCLTPPEELWLYEGGRINSVTDYMLTELTKESSKELGNSYMGSVWTKVYRRSVVKDVRFNPNVKMCEDMLFNLEYMLLCRKIGLIPEAWYTYYNNSYSATNKARTAIMPQQLEFSNALNQLRPQIQTSYPCLENAMNICLFWKMEYCLRTVYMQKEKHLTRAMRSILSYAPFIETEKIRTTGYLGVRLRTKLIFGIMKFPRCLRAWLFQVYYALFYSMSWLVHHFK